MQNDANQANCGYNTACGPDLCRLPSAMQAKHIVQDPTCCGYNTASGLDLYITIRNAGQACCGYATDCGQDLKTTITHVWLYYSPWPRPLDYHQPCRTGTLWLHGHLWKCLLKSVLFYIHIYTTACDLDLYITNSHAGPSTL